MNCNYNGTSPTTGDQFNSTSRIPHIRMGTKVPSQRLIGLNNPSQRYSSEPLNHTIRPTLNSASNIRRDQIRYTAAAAGNLSSSPVVYIPHDELMHNNIPNFYMAESNNFGATSYRQLSNTYGGNAVPPMSYNLRYVPESTNQPFPSQLRAHSNDYLQHYPGSSPSRRYSGSLEPVEEHDYVAGEDGRLTDYTQNLTCESNTVIRICNDDIPNSSMNQPASVKTISETDIVCGSSSAGDEDCDEDEVVKSCAADENSRRSYGGEFVAASSSDESDDPELLELREREQIVEKYEKGPDSKDVDPWENPDFELYKVTDRYGFVHKSASELTAEENERRRVDRELKREQKWLRMLEEWKRRHPEKLPNRIWKGIPDKLRLVYWKRLLNVEEMKASAKPNLYNELLMRARLVSKEVKQIDLDINRTYRDHLAFRRRYDVKQQSLFNVLAAYAMFNTEVGYCQGMSQIAAIFLMYMDEEDAFWCMHSLLSNRKYSMHGFFVPGFPKLARFQNHYEKVIQKYLPKLQKHLDKAGIPNIHLTKWWFGCFLDRVPFSLAIRVWDVFLYFGDSILIAMAYNIMKMHKKTIMKLSMEGFMEFIQQKLAADFGYSNDHVMESLEECLKRLQSDRMALPPPPNPDDPSELPTKPLGPILMRSMIDIRMDIAEIHSRSSRANSFLTLKFIDEA